MSKYSLSSLAAKLSEKSGLSPMEAELFIRKMFEVCHQGLETDKQVKMRWLGTFKVTSVKDRESVDVNTGERIVIEGRDKISFTPDNILKEIVNKPFAQFETVVVNDGVDFDEIDQKFEAEMEEAEQELKEVAQSEVAEKQSEVAQNNATDNIQAAEETPVKETSEETPEEAPEEETSVEETSGEEINGVIDFLHTPDAPSPTSDVVIIGDGVVSQHVSGSSDVFETAEEDTTEVSEKQNDHPEEDVHVMKEDCDIEAKSDVQAEVEAVSKALTASEAETVSEVEAEVEAELRRSHFILPKVAVAITGVVVLALIGGMGWFAFHYGQMAAQVNDLAMQLDHYKTAKAAPKPHQKTQEEILSEKAREDSLRMLQASEALKAAEQAEKDSIATANRLASHQLAESSNQANGKLASTDNAKEKLAKQKMEQEKLLKEKQAKEQLLKDKQTKAQKAADTKTTATKLAANNKTTAAYASKYDSDARVRTGAYRIVGVAQTVTVGEGQSLAAISKRYLGPGMECYIEALNGTASVKSGQKIKIPKLELKKKK